MTNDSQLQTAVLDELAWEPSVTAAHIGVTALNGTVTLTGHVETYPEKHAAETAARRVKGVRALADELEVRLSSDSKRDDADIAAAIVDRLGWDVSLPTDSVSATVTDGWVTLTGQVSWPFQHDAAQMDVRSLHGVTGVTNEISLKPTPDTGNIPNAISNALRRAWPSEPGVHVTASQGHVVLTGSVDSMDQWLLAGATAWKAPGVTAVLNELVVA